MHGTEHRIQEHRARGLSASRVVFLAPLGSTLPGQPQLSPQWDRSLVTAFRSPATAPAFTDSIPGSTFLACRFASCSVALRPVRLSAPPPLPVCPGRGSFSACARRLFASLPDRLVRRPPLPFGTFTSLGIIAFCRFRADQPAFRLRPISLRSPHPPSIASCGNGSTFQVRYVSGGSLFLKPLGTFLTMRFGHGIVNRYFSLKSPFHQNIFSLNPATYVEFPVQKLWKKHGRPTLFAPKRQFLHRVFLAACWRTSLSRASRSALRYSIWCVIW